MPARRPARAEFHPPGNADHGRRPPADGAAEYVRFRLLRLDHGGNRHRRAGRDGSSRAGCADQEENTTSSCRRLRGDDASAGQGHCGGRRRRGGRLCVGERHSIQPRSR